MSQFMSQREFLEASGVLSKGTQEEIQTKKSEYRKLYHRAYKRRRRQKHPEITITLTSEEAVLLRSHAHEYGQSLSTFIHKSALAYVRKKYLVPNHELVARIEQLVSLTYSEIQQLAKNEGETISGLYEQLQARIEQLERGVSQVLRQPKELEEMIHKRLQRQPEFRTTLYSLLKP